MKSEKKKSIKSVVIKVAVAFLIIIALLAYFSGTIDNFLLPHVTMISGGEGSLKHNLKATATLEPPAEGSVDGGMSFRFTCPNALDGFVRVGSVVDFKAAVKTAESRVAYRDGTAVVLSVKATGKELACTAEVREIALKNGETLPESGGEIAIDTVFETPRYKHVVMKSAIQNGSYVYLVRRGEDKKHYVAKVEVTVLAESDFYAAIEMDADSLPFVLTSTKDIHDGQRVIVDG